jgi:hypothetical protein
MSVYNSPGCLNIPFINIDIAVSDVIGSSLLTSHTGRRAVQCQANDVRFFMILAKRIYLVTGRIIKIDYAC